MNKNLRNAIKALMLFVCFSFIQNETQAQTFDNGIFFQALARDSYSNPAKDRKIYVQSTIIQNSVTGTKVLVEEFQVTTDASGVFGISIGKGTRTSGTMSGLNNIDWSAGPYFLNLQISITPIAPLENWNYTKDWIDLGTTSFGTVPYALHAKTVAGFDTKLNVSDTARMLSTYAKTQLVNTKLNIVDTITLSNRINLKANATDVATNTANIVTNTNDIATLNTNVAANTANIATNTTNIVTNTNNIATLNTNVTANTASIATNSSDIALKANISSLATVATSGNYNDLTNKPTNFVSSIGNVSVTSNAKGATLNSGALSLTPADLTNAGIVTTGTQTFAGNKTISGSLATTGTVTAGVVIYPNTHGISGQVLTTSGTGALTWTTPASTLNASSITGVVSVANGGTGQTTIPGILSTLGLSSNNIAIGNGAGTAGQGVNANTVAIGGGAGQTAQGQSSIGIGYVAGYANQGANSLAIGGNAAQTNQGTQAVALGYAAGQNGQGAYSVALGAFAGNSQVANSIAINATGANLNPSNAGFYVNPIRTATATSTLLYYNNSTKEITSATGTGSFVDLTSNQTIAGVKTFSSNINVNGVVVGRGNGNNDESVAIGSSAMGASNVNGKRNTAVGAGAMRQYNGTSWDNNTSIGYSNLPSLTSGSGNTSVGAEAMLANLTGTENTSVGNQSLINTTGNNNIGIGKRSGQTITTGSQNTVVGTDADVAINNLNNATAIGYGANVAASNTIQLGNTDITNVKTSGSLTAGNVTYPNTDGTNGQVLTTNGSGTASWNVVNAPQYSQVLLNDNSSDNTPVTLGGISIRVYNGELQISRLGNLDPSTFVVYATVYKGCCGAFNAASDNSGGPITPKYGTTVTSASIGSWTRLLDNANGYIQTIGGAYFKLEADLSVYNSTKSYKLTALTDGWGKVLLRLMYFPN